MRFSFANVYVTLTETTRAHSTHPTVLTCGFGCRTSGNVNIYSCLYHTPDTLIPMVEVE